MWFGCYISPDAAVDRMEQIADNVAKIDPLLEMRAQTFQRLLRDLPVMVRDEVADEIRRRAQLCRLCGDPLHPNVDDCPVIAALEQDRR
jgi:hypothetical protein